MSTTVTPGTGGANGTIKFEYTVASILEEVESTTANIASKLEGDAEALDKYTLTADENFHFTEYLKEAHLNVSRVLKKMTLGIANAITIDNTKVTYIIVNKSAYNASVLPVFDKIIIDTLKNFILKEWYVQCALKDWAEYYGAKYQESLKNISKHSTSLRGGSIT